jgi:hypothetical protein
MSKMGKSRNNRKTDLLFSGYWSYLLFSGLTIVYLFFPTNTHLADSFDYGASVKYGYKLFSAHHLLYNYSNHLIFKGVQTILPTVDALKVMQFTNAVFAIFCLLLLRRILKTQFNNEVKANIWTLFVGCSFGLMRFATEAETYIIPIFFSLLSSFHYQNYLNSKKDKYILYSGLMASIACLFHQIHLFWGIGLFLGFLKTKRFKSVFLYLVTTPLVLVVYSIVLVYYNKAAFSGYNLFRFLAEYYFSAKADVQVGTSNLVITIITFFRTFFQVHGTILEVLKLQPATYIAIILAVTLLFISIFKFSKSVKFHLSNKEKPFEWTHFIIFVLQLGFAFYSHGNSEFMVMIPFLIAIFYHLFLDFNLAVIKYLAVMLFIWNFTFGIYPNQHYDYQNNKTLLKIIKDNPDKIFILKESYLIVNQYFYEYGEYNCYRILDNDDKPAIKKLKRSGAVFYTDVFTKQTAYSRVEFTLNLNYRNLVFIRHINPVRTTLGGFYIDEVKCLD